MKTVTEVEAVEYSYDRSLNDRYVLKRNGTTVHMGSEQDVWSYLHKWCPYSVSHALRYEGYSIEPEVSSPA